MIHEVTALDLPELRPYRTLRRPLDHRKQGIFVAEGAKVVERLIDSRLSIVSMLMTHDWYDQLFGGKVEPPFSVYLAPKSLLQTIVGFPLHQGIMAMAKVPPERSLEDVVSTLPQPFILVALDGIVSAENVGVIVRNAVAFGVNAIISAESSSSPYLRRAVRNSMGAVFQIPVCNATNIVEALSWLSRCARVRIIAAHPAGEIRLGEADLAGNSCLVFGNEGDGLLPDVLEVCDLRVAIPMLNQTDSLNVSSAAAVFLYETRRQHGWK